MIILRTVFSSGSNTKKTNSRCYLPSNHWNSAIFMGLFISLAITANLTTMNNIFVAYSLPPSRMLCIFCYFHKCPHELQTVTNDQLKYCWSTPLGGRRDLFVPLVSTCLRYRAPPAGGDIHSYIQTFFLQESIVKLPSLF